MCGIIGAVAQRNVIPILLEGLRRLEYRGYDSAGLVVVEGGLQRIRVSGRVRDLQHKVNASGVAGLTGMAHTRWATHGAPTENNAHPHISGDLIAVVHNGIIENYEALRTSLEAEGYCFTSETDTEVIAHLIHHHYAGQARDLLDAMRLALAELAGTYAIVVASADQPGRLLGARQGSPLVIGLGIEECYVASDIYALLPVTQNFIYLEEGDVTDLRISGCLIFDREGQAVERRRHVSELSGSTVDLGPYRHFMQKEIHEQPNAMMDTLSSVSPLFEPEIFGQDASKVLAEVRRVSIIACGTSFHAGLIARYWIEKLAGIPCDVEVASEYRYRQGVIDPQGLVVTISQSGETADTLAAVKYARTRGVTRFLTICNVSESSLVRLSDLRFLTRAGPEIGVASTKAFTTQLLALFTLAVTLGRLRFVIDDKSARSYYHHLSRLPKMAGEVLLLEPALKAWAEHFVAKDHALFLGRGIHYPVAMEGALKLKEISYIHAEAYPAGELKHGPLALVNKEMPVVGLVPHDDLLEKLKSNLQEVRARGGELFVFADQGSRMRESEGRHVLVLPGEFGELSPILHVIPLQLLAYHTAVLRGTDVDKPRNLAKSVTVE